MIVFFCISQMSTHLAECVRLCRRLKELSSARASHVIELTSTAAIVTNCLLVMLVPHLSHCYCLDENEQNENDRCGLGLWHNIVTQLEVVGVS